MISHCFATRTRHSFQGMFFRFFEPVRRVSRRITINESELNCLFRGHYGLTYAAQYFHWLQVQCLAIQDPFKRLNDCSLRTIKLLQETNNFCNGTTNLLREANYPSDGTTNLLRETNNPSNGTTNLLRETNNPSNGTTNLLRETNNPSNGTANLLRETIYPSNGTTNLLRETYEIDSCCNVQLQVKQTSVVQSMNCIKPFLRVVPGSEADTCCDNGNKVNVINQCIVPQSAQCIQRGRYSRPRSQARLRSQVKTRVRDREPSRISLRKVIDSLNRRKFRRKHKNLLRKSVPVSSVLHSIATNYKHWKIRFTQKQDSFYSNYFMKISTTVYDLAEKNILLSGDIELNPGPVTNNSTSLGIIANERSNFLLNYRLLQHGLRTIDVGGGGDCFFKSVSHQLYGDSNHHLEIKLLLTAGQQRMIADKSTKIISQFLSS